MFQVEHKYIVHSVKIAIANPVKSRKNGKMSATTTARPIAKDDVLILFLIVTPPVPAA
jgi:hypothetical protein